MLNEQAKKRLFFDRGHDSSLPIHSLNFSPPDARAAKKKLRGKWSHKKLNSHTNTHDKRTTRKNQQKRVNFTSAEPNFRFPKTETPCMSFCSIYCTIKIEKENLKFKVHLHNIKLCERHYILMSFKGINMLSTHSREPSTVRTEGRKESETAENYEEHDGIK
jgi:hypothetical protein